MDVHFIKRERERESTKIQKKCEKKRIEKKKKHMKGKTDEQCTQKKG